MIAVARMYLGRWRVTDRLTLNCFKRGKMNMLYAGEWSVVVGVWGGVIVASTDKHALQQTGAMTQDAALHALH